MINKIVTIQSQVVSGYVGNSIATLAIQLHGLDTIALPTVLLSAHTGHETVYGQATPKSLFQDLVKGVEAIHVLDQVRYVISGYIGSEDIIAATAQFVHDMKQADNQKLYICDPVMGDIKHGGLYVSESVASQLTKELIPLCDILTPNHFEIEYILQKEVKTLNELLTAVNEHPVLSPKTVIVTSSDLVDTPEDMIEIIVVANKQVERICAKRVDVELVGTGDLFTSLLASQMTKGLGVIEAVKLVSTFMSEVINYAKKNPRNEINSESLLRFVGMLNTSR